MSETPRFVLPSAVRMHMTDVTGSCRAADLMRLMQEAATLQSEQYHLTRKELVSRGQAFILSRFSIDFPSCVRYFEQLDTETWPCTSSRGVAFDRCFEIKRASARVSDTEQEEPDLRLPVARAVSQWALVDYINHKLIRVEDAAITFTREESVTPSIPLRFRIPKAAQFRDIGEHPVVYTDIDVNRHVNNTRYCDIYCDFLPMEDAAGNRYRVASVAIAYLKEAVLGDTIRVTRTDAPDGQGLYYIRTYLQSDNTLNTEAAVRLVPVSHTES